LLPARLAAWVLGLFGAVALVLATLGLYAVISYAVAQRRREVGIRMALGARVPHVLALVIGQGLRLTGMGMALGVLAALALMRLVRIPVRRGPRPGGWRDPVPGAEPCWPARCRRARDIDPAVAPRYEDDDRSRADSAAARGLRGSPPSWRCARNHGAGMAPAPPSQRGGRGVAAAASPPDPTSCDGATTRTGRNGLAARFIPTRRTGLQSPSLAALGVPQRGRGDRRCRAAHVPGARVTPAFSRPWARGRNGERCRPRVIDTHR
jgi:hypothetical protein